MVLSRIPEGQKYAQTEQDRTGMKDRTSKETKNILSHIEKGAKELTENKKTQEGVERAEPVESQHTYSRKDSTATRSAKDNRTEHEGRSSCVFHHQLVSSTGNFATCIIKSRQLGQLGCGWAGVVCAQPCKGAGGFCRVMFLLFWAAVLLMQITSPPIFKCRNPAAPERVQCCKYCLPPSRPLFGGRDAEMGEFG